MIKCTCAFPCGGTTNKCPTTPRNRSTIAIANAKAEAERKRRRIIQAVIKSGLMEDSDKVYVLDLLYSEIKKEINKNK
jgi:hypothetical protein